MSEKLSKIDNPQPLSNPQANSVPMAVNHQKDPFTRIEWYIYRTTFVLLIIFEVSKFAKHLVESW